MLIGRELEEQRIRGLLRAPLPAGQVRVIQIEGPLGIGKSALLASALSHLHKHQDTAAGAPMPRVFLAHGDRLHTEAPLSAHRVMVEQILTDRIETLLDVATPAVLGARCAQALSDQDVPVVVAVDDAQWLDPASIAFLTAFIQTPAPIPLTLVLVHRTGQAPLNLLTLARSRGAAVEHIVLDALPDDVVERLLTGVTHRQRRAVVAAAQGNPLFARTASAAFRRHPQADRLDQVMRLSAGDHDKILSAAIADDMATLPATSRRVLEALTLLGAVADADTLMRVTGLDADGVESGARTLAARGLLIESGHEVLHPVVRLSVYQNIPSRQRAELHRRVAGLPEIELFDRADHLARAAPDLTAEDVQTLVRAARVAIGSEPVAVLEWLRGLGAGQHTEESTTLLARARILTGDLYTAIETLRALIELQPRAGEARVLLANVLRMAGQEDDARVLLAATADSVDAEVLREYIDVVALLDGRAPERFVSRLESLPGEVNKVVAAIYRTMDLLVEGRIRQARTTFLPVPAWMKRAEALEVASVLHAVACAVWAAYLLDQYETGAQIAERGLTLARRYGQADVLANLGTGLCFCLASLGLLDEAETAGEQAIEHAERYGAPDLVSMALTGLLVAAQGRADMTVLQERLDRLNEAPLPRFGWWRRAVLTTRTRISAVLGSPVACPELLGEPIDVMAALRHADAATAAAAMGDLDTAHYLIAQGLRIAEEQDSQGQRAMLLTTQAEILLRTGDALKAGNLLRTAATTFQRLGMRLQLGRAQGGIARAEAALAQRSEQFSVLTAREREIADLVADGLTNREIAARLVVSPRTPEYHIRNVLKKLGLSSREEIAALMVKGDGRPLEKT